MLKTERKRRRRRFSRPRRPKSPHRLCLHLYRRLRIYLGSDTVVCGCRGVPLQTERQGHVSQRRFVSFHRRLSRRKSNELTKSVSQELALELWDRVCDPLSRQPLNCRNQDRQFGCQSFLHLGKLTPLFRR